MSEIAERELFPPGEYIRDELESRSWTQEDLAEILGRPLRTINQIILGKVAITAQTAQELAAAFGTSPELWVNLEGAYRLALESTAKEEVAERSRLFEFAPVKDMAKRNWIKDTSEPAAIERELLRFFKTDSLDRRPALSAAARMSASYESLNPSQFAWLFRARQLGEAVHAKTFDRSKVCDHLDALHRLTVSEQEVRHVPKVLADMGIRFVVVQHLPKTKIDGAVIWLDEDRPVIAVSLRYDRIDGFWHTLAHEVRHVVHGDGSVDDDLVGAAKIGTSSVVPAELRADREAARFLIPDDVISSFVDRHHHRFSRAKVIQFSNLHQIHPGIVIGQLHHRGALPYTHLREMLVPVRELLTQVSMTDGWGHHPGI
ncbi:MAG TPA: helix-turn-helix domain-containing protein [Pirellulales bacterium]|nr:helix-turn-helix domain-containing protein [Pirellulales bacterium]